MSEHAELKAEYVKLAGKNPPPLSTDALRAKVAELKAAATTEPAPSNAGEPESSTSSAAKGSEAPTLEPSEPQAPPAPNVKGPVAGPSAVIPSHATPDDLAAELEELGLSADAEGMVDLVMVAGLSGPELCLSPKDAHRCGAEEALRLARAGFAVAA